MASSCLAEQGNCLICLGRLDKGAATFEKSIAIDEKMNNIGSAAISQGQLGIVRSCQKRYTEALKAYDSAIQSFKIFGDLFHISIYLHHMGIVFQTTGNYPAAETAYRKSLKIRIQQNYKGGEADSLAQLGNLFQTMAQLEDAITFYRQAVDIFFALGDKASEGNVRNNLAGTFIKLKRYDDARQEIVRAIECKKPFGHTAEPWKTWDILCDIEQAQGNAIAAKNARDQAVALYMAFRRSGGGNMNMWRSCVLWLGMRFSVARGLRLRRLLGSLVRAGNLD